VLDGVYLCGAEGIPRFIEARLAYTLTVLRRITPRLLAFVGAIGTLITGALAPSRARSNGASRSGLRLGNTTRSSLIRALPCAGIAAVPCSNWHLEYSYLRCICFTDTLTLSE
jgi:hypothetical protein